MVRTSGQLFRSKVREIDENAFAGASALPSPCSPEIETFRTNIFCESSNFLFLLLTRKKNLMAIQFNNEWQNTTQLILIEYFGVFLFSIYRQKQTGMVSMNDSACALPSFPTMTVVLVTNFSPPKWDVPMLWERRLCVEDLKRKKTFTVLITMIIKNRRMVSLGALWI